MAVKYHTTFDESVELYDTIGIEGADLMFPVSRETGFISEIPVLVDENEGTEFPCWSVSALVGMLSSVSVDEPVSIEVYDDACVIVVTDEDGVKHKEVGDTMIDAAYGLVVRFSEKILFMRKGQDGKENSSDGETGQGDI